jgi:chromosome segregation ATPase
VRNDTASAVAELTMLDRDLDTAADEVGQSRALAADALRKADAARGAGDEAEAGRWERTARGVAGRLVSAEDRLAALQGTYEASAASVDRARAAEAQAARELAALEGRRRELLGDLAGVSAAEQDLGPAHARLDRVAADVQGRVARAQAKAELDALEAPVLEGPAPAPDDERAEAALEGLRRELGSGS